MLLGFYHARHSTEKRLASVEVGQTAHSKPIMKPIMILLKSLPQTVDSTDVHGSARRNPVAAVDLGFCAASRPSTERWGRIGGGCRGTGHVKQATKIRGHGWPISDGTSRSPRKVASRGWGASMASGGRG